MAPKKKPGIKKGRAQSAVLPLIGLTVFGLLIRVLFTLLVRPYDSIGLSPDGFSAETSRIASHLAQGLGYAGAFYPGLPTAHIEPAYPVLMAVVFKLFGICSFLSAVVLTYLNVILSAATIPLVFILARKIYDEKSAWLAAWVFCLYPSAFWRSFNLWSETLATFLFMIVLILWTLWLEKQTIRRSVLAGIGCGLSMLTTAASMSFIACTFILALWIKRPATRAFLLRLGTIGLTLAIVLAPWLIRNYSVFHELVPVRTTAIIEFTYGNIGSPDGTGKNSCGPHPYTGPERELYGKVGEMDYTNIKTAQFKEWLTHNPLQFIELSVLRAYWFWFGDPLSSFGIVKKIIHLLPTLLLGVWLWSFRQRSIRVPELLLLLLFAVYPLPYYVTSVTSRYRYLIEPAMLIAGMYALRELYARTFPAGFKISKK